MINFHRTDTAENGYCSAKVINLGAPFWDGKAKQEGTKNRKHTVRLCAEGCSVLCTLPIKWCMFVWAEQRGTKRYENETINMTFYKSTCCFGGLLWWFRRAVKLKACISIDHNELSMLREVQTRSFGACLLYSKLIRVNCSSKSSASNSVLKSHMLYKDMFKYYLLSYLLR